jgi:hypothetical protein
MPSTSSSSSDLDNSLGRLNMINKQKESVMRITNNGVGDEQFMLRILLDYIAPQIIDARGLIRLSRLTGDPSSYDVSTINILQNNCYHELEHKDPHDHIQTFLQ